MRISGKEFVADGFDPTELAYQVTCKTPGTSGALSLELRAKKDSPVVNPAFVVKNWGFRDVELELNGESIARGQNFRFGFRETLDRSNRLDSNRVDQAGEDYLFASSKLTATVKSSGI
jgi:hypothetical protein